MDILYPAELPDGVQITKISQQIIAEDFILYSIHFTDTELSMAISSEITVSEEDLRQYEQYISADTTFFIAQTSDGMFQAIGHYDGAQYLICSKSYNMLLFIIDNMKGIER